MICTPRADLSTRMVEDEVVVLDKRTGRIHQLNSTASFVWNKLDGKTSIPAIVSDLVQTFDVEFEVARADVARIVADLVGLELVSTTETDETTKRSP